MKILHSHQGHRPWRIDSILTKYSRESILRPEHEGRFSILSLGVLGQLGRGSASGNHSGWDIVLFHLGKTPVSVAGLINFFLFVLLGFLLRHFLKKTLTTRAQTQSSPQTRHMMGLLSTLAANLVFALAIVIGLDNLGVRLSFLGGTLGVLGIGIGIGLQNLAANMIGLVVILLEKSIQIGDLIEIDGVLGTVVEIKGRSTTVMSRDNIAIIIPNAHLIANKVINWSHRDPKTRMHLKVGIGMDPSLLNRAVDILMTIARNHPDILPDPPPTVWFTEFGASSFNLELIYWINDVTLRHTTLSDLNFRIASEFHAAGIDLPYPHNVVIFSGKGTTEAPPLAPGTLREDNDTHENRNSSYDPSRKA